MTWWGNGDIYIKKKGQGQDVASGMKYNIKRSQGTCVFKSLKYSPNEIMGFNANARVKTLCHLFLLSTHQWFLVLTFGHINTKVSQTLLGDSAAVSVVQRERKKRRSLCNKVMARRGLRVTSSFWEAEAKQASSKSLSVTSLPPNPTSQ